MEKELNEFIEKLKQTAGENLQCAVLYGSAAAGEFHPTHSDLNVLCVLARLGAAELEALSPVVAGWARKGQPPPVLFTLEGLRRSVDVFPIEFLDIKANRRVLYGEDLFAALEVPLDRHRAQLERELRINLIRLRERYLLVARDRRAVARLLAKSLSTFAALFRHVLVELGEQPSTARRETLDRLAARLGFDAQPFHAVLDLREGKSKERHLDAAATFRGVLAGVEKIVEAVDRGLTA